jgi:hypothetical protein
MPTARPSSSWSLRRLVLGIMLAAIVGLPVVTIWLLLPTLREPCIRNALDQASGPSFWWPPSWRRELAILKKLREPVTLNFVKTPLHDVSAFLHDYMGVPFDLDEPTLRQIGNVKDPTVTIEVEQISMASTLKLMLDSLDAKCRIEAGVIRITSRQSGEKTMPELAAPKPASPAEQRVHKGLQIPVTLEFEGTELYGLFGFLRDYAQVNIVLDRKRLDPQGFDLATPITIHVEQIPLSEALRILLDPLHATYTIQDEVLWITAKAPSD